VPSAATAEKPGQVTLSLAQANGTSQSGTAVLTETEAGLRVTVEVNVADVGQLAAIARGTCEELGLLYSHIDANGGLEPPSGRFETDVATRFDNAAPVGLAELQASDFAIVVADFEVRAGGLLSELPPDTRLLEGPSGWEARPLAACGDIP
jgi:hypothetical protein